MFLCGDNNKPRSLVEQKKLQWAKEREELAKLTVPWGKHMKNYAKTTRVRNPPKSPNDYYQQESFKNLPPIHQNQKNEKYPEYDRYEIEGDTSGYASDSNKESTPDHLPDKPVEYQIWSNWHRSSESDLSSGRDERPKWGDRGLGVGHLWDPRELNENAKAVEPPGWLQRGLRRDKELIVSQSPDQQSQQSDLDRPFTGESTITNATQRTHLRGQNIPLEPTEIIERERKRQKALELQSAIKQQLEEREIKRKQEQERILREEAELEERIRKEQELERRRVEEEEKMMREKKERERQRNEAMQEALKIAEKEAKEKKKNKKVVKSKTIDDGHFEEAHKEPPKSQPKLTHSPVHKSSAKSEKNRDIEKPKSAKKEEVTKTEVDKHTDTLDITQIKSTENGMLVLPSPFDNLQNMQIALLLPGTSLGKQDSLQMVPVSDTSFITENRVLTPSVYRNKKHCRESSTQTDNEIRLNTENYTRDDQMGSLDRNRARSRLERRDKRFRSEERSKENRGDRPKWGVNRPPTRYMKQSEKDPIYQKRKLRQKTREIQLIYEDKNNNYSESSDNSSPVTPEHKYRPNRSLWHKNGRMFSQNISVYQTEILPLEFDRQGRMYVKETDIQDMQKLDKHYPRQRYRERYKSPDVYAVEHLSPKYDSERSERRKITDKDYDSERTDNEEVLEKLSSLHKGLMIKQKQWDNNNSHLRPFSNV